jgi:hypothetical protein
MIISGISIIICNKNNTSINNYIYVLSSLSHTNKPTHTQTKTISVFFTHFLPSGQVLVTPVELKCFATFFEQLFAAFFPQRRRSF